MHADDVIFTQEPSIQSLTCSRAASDQTAVFNCHYEGSMVHPYWLINSTSYASLNSQLPPDHSYEFNQLIVENLPGKYTTKYQCFLLFSESGTICAYRSAVGKLIIPNCSNGILYYYYYYYWNDTRIKINVTNTIVYFLCYTYTDLNVQNMPYYDHENKALKEIHTTILNKVLIGNYYSRIMLLLNINMCFFYY